MSVLLRVEISLGRYLFLQPSVEVSNHNKFFSDDQLHEHTRVHGYFWMDRFLQCMILLWIKEMVINLGLTVLHFIVTYILELLFRTSAQEHTVATTTLDTLCVLGLLACSWYIPPWPWWMPISSFPTIYSKPGQHTWNIPSWLGTVLANGLAECSSSTAGT